MKLLVKINLIGLSFIIIGFVIKTAHSLLFAQFTLMQVVCCVSWPVPYKDPLRKLFFNVGFQFNYVEPFSLQTFQNPPFWPNAFDRRAFGKPSTIDTNQTTTAADGDYADITATTEMENSLIEGNSTDESIGIDKRSIEDGNMQWRNEMKLLGSDVTAAQLYESVEENLMGAGYDRTCLLKAICELARHPLHQDDDDEHLLAEVVHFLLTPSEHQGFSTDENYERKKYETAEKIGADGGDCDTIYMECADSFLDEITKIVIENEIVK